jgi:hypothetical protein
MRRFLLVACAAACIVGAPTLALAGLFNPQGQFVGKVNPQIRALLALFPAGGPGLRAAIARAVEADPALADDVVFAARTANAAQKQAMGAGLADAVLFFGRIGSDTGRGAEVRIRWAMTFADAGTVVGFLSEDMPNIAQGILGAGNAGAQTGGCVTIVSQSRPGC